MIVGAVQQQIDGYHGEARSTPLLSTIALSHEAATRSETGFVMRSLHADSGISAL